MAAAARKAAAFATTTPAPESFAEEAGTAGTAEALTAAVAAKKDGAAAAAAAAATAAETPPPLPAPELDLFCNEELDVDEAMKSKGELRTPICRFLVPCWPEGVEGYEEAGGWRRLGGPHTRENFPRGRRSI